MWYASPMTGFKDKPLTVTVNGRKVELGRITGTKIIESEYGPALKLDAVLHKDFRKQFKAAQIEE